MHPGPDSDASSNPLSQNDKPESRMKEYRDYKRRKQQDDTSNSESSNEGGSRKRRSDR